MKYLLVISIAVLNSCSINTYPEFDYNRTGNPWISAYKDRVFFSALREAYNSDSLIFKLIEKSDALNPYDGLSLAEMHQADSIGKALIKNMPAPKMCEGCSGEMNYFMATSLHYYISKELDSLAKNTFRNRLKRNFSK